MTQIPVLNGQDVGEAEGALTALLNKALAETGVSRTKYIALRVLTVRGPQGSPAALAQYLASQPQVGLDADGAAALVADMEANDLVREGNITQEGLDLNARLAGVVGSFSRQVFEGIDIDDLATAGRVVRQITARAAELAGIS